jgi:superfamily II DNA helicase RecQ
MVQILRGSSGAPEKGRESPAWGALRFRSETAVQDLLRRLVGAGLLKARQLEHGGVVLDLTPAGRAALQDAALLEPLLFRPKLPSRSKHKPVQKDECEGQIDEAFFQRLRAWRRETARVANLPPYVVAQDELLRRIATSRPQNTTELAAIKGMGPKKLEQYGAAILALVREEEPPDSLP